MPYHLIAEKAQREAGYPWSGLDIPDSYNLQEWSAKITPVCKMSVSPDTKDTTWTTKPSASHVY